jgi:hypothetical protein
MRTVPREVNMVHSKSLGGPAATSDCSLSLNAEICNNCTLATLPSQTLDNAHLVIRIGRK